MATVSLVPGQLFAGDFTIERELSEGGMGVVYVALQRSTGKQRALKVMQPGLVSAKDPAQAVKNQQRFLAEARAGGGIKSEHIVEVLGAGVDAPTGAPWLVMELLDGHDLDAEITQRERLPPAEVHELYVQLCHALGAAHRVGVCHLDLKPENIFLARSHSARGGQTVKVLDFGIARLVSEHKRSTTVTSAVGSPFWMSPEQSTRGARVGAYTDVWALGLIAFKLLTGKHYWREANVPPEELNVTGWLMEMMTSELSAASARAGEFGVAQHLPAGFDAWFARCVVRDVNARFADADDALEALGKVLTTPSPPPRPPSDVRLAPTQPMPAPPRSPVVATIPVEAVFPVADGSTEGRSTDGVAAPVREASTRAAWVPLAVGGAALVAVTVLGVGALRHSGGTPQGVTDATPVSRPLDVAARDPMDRLPGETDRAFGARLFQQGGCNRCHDGSGGPRLNNVFGQDVLCSDGTSMPADENYFRRSILDPNAQVVRGYQPTCVPRLRGATFNDLQIDALIAYFRSLSTP